MLGYNNNSMIVWLLIQIVSVQLFLTLTLFGKGFISDILPVTEGKEHIMKDEGYIDLLKYRVVINSGSMCHNMPYLHTGAGLSCIE